MPGEAELSDSQHTKIMAEFDIDGSKTLNFDEFLHAFVRTPLQKVPHLEHKIGQLGKGVREQMSRARQTPEERVCPVRAAVGRPSGWRLRTDRFAPRHEDRGR